MSCPTHPANGQVFPKLQHVTIADLLDGKLLPYIAANKLQQTATQDTLY
jgi:hypothetical protein